MLSLWNVSIPQPKMNSLPSEHVLRPFLFWSKIRVGTLTETNHSPSKGRIKCRFCFFGYTTVVRSYGLISLVPACTCCLLTEICVHTTETDHRSHCVSVIPDGLYTTLWVNFRIMGKYFIKAMWVSLLLGLKFHINSTGNFPARMEKVVRALGS